MLARLKSRLLVLFCRLLLQDLKEFRLISNVSLKAQSSLEILSNGILKKSMLLEML